MYGWRAKIGLITPMCQSVERAFHIYAPEGVSVASTKIEDVKKSRQLRAEAAKFKNKNIDVVVLGCALDNDETDDTAQSCISIIEQSSGVPAITTGMAIFEGLQNLEAKKVAVLTPYGEEQNHAVKGQLERHGYEVSRIIGMDMQQFADAGLHAEDADEHFLYQYAIHMDLKDADVFLLEGIELTTMEMIDALETVMEIPVITSQQAAMWCALRHCRVGAQIPKAGKLFAF